MSMMTEMEKKMNNLKVTIREKEMVKNTSP